MRDSTRLKPSGCSTLSVRGSVDLVKPVMARLVEVQATENGRAAAA